VLSRLRSPIEGQIFASGQVYSSHSLTLSLSLSVAHSHSHSGFLVGCVWTLRKKKKKNKRVIERKKTKTTKIYHMQVSEFHSREEFSCDFPRGFLLLERSVIGLHLRESKRGEACHSEEACMNLSPHPPPTLALPACSRICFSS
jgi:hypothetical protein